MMKNRLHHESGEPIEEPVHPSQQRRIQQGQLVFSEDYLSSARVDQHTGWQYWPSTSSSSWWYASDWSWKWAHKIFWARISVCCYSWFRLQLIAIHCNRRGVWTEHPHTAHFFLHTHLRTCTCMAQGDSGSVCENILIHMSSRFWSFVISSCLISSSLPSVSSLSLISSYLLSWSSSSMWSEPPSTKSTAHTQNEEHCTVTIHNPLTWMFFRPRSSNFSHHLLPHRRHWLEFDWTLVQLRSGVDLLAIWPIRSQTQVMSQSSVSTRKSSFQLENDATSQSSASMSVASTRRSTFRPETWVFR